jgi:site-specific DNA-methyltransferase (adenine-specific)
VLNHIAWIKPEGRHLQTCKADLRQFFPQTERIIFAEHLGADNIAKGEAGYGAKCDELRGFIFEPLRKYLDDSRKAAGLDKIAINVACGFSASPGGMASRHYFSRSQWWLPTEDHYQAIQRLAPAHFTRTYEDLRLQYEDLRLQYEDLRRPFQVSADVPYTDVWTFRTVPTSKDKHPCEKPQDLLRHIITASSRPNAVVLDAFAGSGSTGEAALTLGRRFIGIELDPAWVTKITKRLECL